ncbi:MAG: oligosaccharide flippase family protein [Promethearchaeota archaeon]
MEQQDINENKSSEMNLIGTDDFIQNSYILMVGYLISIIISTIGTILIIRWISVFDYSLINIANIIPSILILFGELGLNYASINFIAKKLKENDINGAKNVVKINLIVKIIIALIFSISVMVSSVLIAKYIYNFDDADIILLIQLCSIGIFSTILFETMNSFFLGAQNMKVVQYGAILRSSLRTGLSLILILYGYTLIGPILGSVLAPLIVVIFYIYFLIKQFKTRKTENVGKNPIEWKELNKMMKYGYPLLIFSILAGIQGQIFILILTIYGYINEVSYFNVAIVSSTIIAILIKSISFSLFPIFSKMEWDIEKERKRLIKYFQFSNKFATLLIIPVSIFLILFSSDIFPIIFGEDYLEAAPFISIYFCAFLFVSFGSISIPAFFNGQQKTKEVLFIQLIFLISSTCLALLFISYFGSLGIMVGLVLGELLSVIYGNIRIRKTYGNILFKNLKNIVGVLLIAILIGILIFILKNYLLNFYNIKEVAFKILFLLILLFLYGIIFLITIGALSLISIGEINFFVKSFDKFPLINKIIKFLAFFMKKLLFLKKNK